MQLKIKNRIRLLAVMFIPLYMSNLWAQEKLPPSRLVTEEEKISILSAGFDYYSNTISSGTLTNEVKQPAYAGSISFFSTYNLFLSTSIMYLDNSNDSLDDFSSQYDIILGYTGRIGEHFEYALSYTWNLFSDNSARINRLFSNQPQAGIWYKKNVFQSGVEAVYYFGDYQTYTLSFEQSYAYSKESLLFQNDYLSIEPELALVCGNYKYLDNYLVDNPTVLLSFDTDYIRDLLLYVAREKFYHPELENRDIIEDKLAQDSPAKFTLTALNLSVPVYYMLGNFSFTLSATLYLPLNQPSYLGENKLYFMWNGGVGYSLGF